MVIAAVAVAVAKSSKAGSESVDTAIEVCSMYVTMTTHNYVRCSCGCFRQNSKHIQVGTVLIFKYLDLLDQLKHSLLSVG